MKRKIKALKILISEFYESHKRVIEKIIIILFVVVGVIIFSSDAIILTKPIEPTKEEIEYCEEKANKIVNGDFLEISNQIKEMEHEGYTVKLEYENNKLTIGLKDITTEIVFSYSLERVITYEINYYSLVERIGITLVMAMAGGIMGYLAYLICLLISAVILVFRLMLSALFDVVLKIRRSYKKTLKRVEEEENKLTEFSEDLESTDKEKS